jgi:hypothetical protein
LVYQDDNKLDALSPDELDALAGACTGWVEQLERGGHYIFSAGLQSVRTATTLRRRNGKLSATVGPFVETTEVLGGFTLINARDLNEAIHLASQFPAEHLGSIEVRPILESDGELSNALDQKIAAAIRRNSSGIDPAVASRMASVPQPKTAREP